MSLAVEDTAVRSIHLSGGCRAIGAEHGLQIQPVASNGRTATIKFASADAAYTVLKELGFEVIGVDFYRSVEQTDGRALPDWRSYHPVGGTCWPCADQADIWSFLAHSAFGQRNGRLWDVASRIKHQLRTCDWRLRQVSQCYRDQLVAIVRGGKLRDGDRFRDRFTWLGYLAIQSYLVDACILRDYLAEYRGLLLSQSGERTFKTPVTSAGSLKKQYLDSNSRTRENREVRSVDDAFARATEARGWLNLLGKYRDIVVHCAPLASSAETLYASSTSVRLDPQTTLPSIGLPLPADPGEVLERRQSESYWEDPELKFARFLQGLEAGYAILDGLEYSHSTLGQLAVLASELAAISPVKPQMPSLTREDLIDVKVTKRADDQTGNAPGV